MHALVRSRGGRRQYFGTFFLRNRPQLELIRRLALQRGGSVRVAVLGCSLGAEVYSIVWSIRRSQPDLSVGVRALDISSEVLEVAREGEYALGRSELADEPICERMTQEEIASMFDEEGSRLRVKPWIKDGIEWSVGDARDPKLAAILGSQDIVVANDFLCHMDPHDAETCLRSIARLVDRNGYLVVSGIDLDVRTSVARDLGWNPVRELLEDIHDGDRSLRASWPWRYWGLEPLDKTRPDWPLRYASVFQLGASA
jgi:SAM-dependent methyltransferase